MKRCSTRRRTLAEQIPCLGKCGKTTPARETVFGQLRHVSDWLCAECHKRLCGCNKLTCKVFEALSDEDEE